MVFCDSSTDAGRSSRRPSLAQELQPGDLLLAATELGIDLVADAALEALLLVEGDELQTARFTNAVL